MKKREEPSEFSYPSEFSHSPGSKREVEIESRRFKVHDLHKEEEEKYE